MNEVVRIGLVLLIALSAVGAGTAAALSTGPGSEDDLGMIEEAYMKKISLDLSYDIEEIERSGEEYNRLDIVDGGIESGDHGEERPFYRYIVKTEGNIKNIEVKMGSPSFTRAEPIPYLVPQVMGEKGETAKKNLDVLR